MQHATDLDNETSCNDLTNVASVLPPSSSVAWNIIVAGGLKHRRRRPETSSPAAWNIVAGGLKHRRRQRGSIINVVGEVCNGEVMVEGRELRELC